MRVLKRSFLAFFFLMIIIVPLVSANDSNGTSNITPFITIDPIGDYVIGDIFFINGTTNLPVTEKLVGTIITTIFIPGGKSGTNYPSAFLSDISIVSTSSDTNRWSVNVTDIAINELPVGWSPYLVSVCPPSNDASPICGYQTFNISAPANSFFTIDPVGSHSVGDVFFVNGTTNLPVSKEWIGWIYRKNGKDDIVGIIVAPGVPGLSTVPSSSGITRWSVNITNVTQNLGTDEYVVVMGINQITSKTDDFSLLPRVNNTGEEDISLIQPTTQNFLSIQSITSQTTVPRTTPSSPLPITLPIVILFIMVVLRFVLKES
jgi:hypothetical protein